MTKEFVKEQTRGMFAIAIIIIYITSKIYFIGAGYFVNPTFLPWEINLTVLLDLMAVCWVGYLFFALMSLSKDTFQATAEKGSPGQKFLKWFSRNSRGMANTLFVLGLVFILLIALAVFWPIIPFYLGYIYLVKPARRRFKKKEKEVMKKMSKYDKLTKSEKERLLVIYQARQSKYLQMIVIGLIILSIGIAFVGALDFFNVSMGSIVIVLSIYAGFAIWTLFNVSQRWLEIRSIEKALDVEGILQTIKSKKETKRSKKKKS